MVPVSEIIMGGLPKTCVVKYYLSISTGFSGHHEVAVRSLYSNSLFLTVAKPARIKLTQNAGVVNNDSSK